MLRCFVIWESDYRKVDLCFNIIGCGTLPCAIAFQCPPEEGVCVVLLSDELE